MKPTGRKKYTDGKASKTYRDTEHAKKIQRAGAKLNQQEKKANTRAKYGPSGRPAPVTVKRLDGVTGEWVEEAPVDQRSITGELYPKRRRRR